MTPRPAIRERLFYPDVEADPSRISREDFRDQLARINGVWPLKACAHCGQLPFFYGYTQRDGSWIAEARCDNCLTAMRHRVPPTENKIEPARLMADSYIRVAQAWSRRQEKTEEGWLFGLEKMR